MAHWVWKLHLMNLRPGQVTAAGRMQTEIFTYGPALLSALIRFTMMFGSLTLLLITGPGLQALQFRMTVGVIRVIVVLMTVAGPVPGTSAARLLQPTAAALL